MSADFSSAGEPSGPGVSPGVRASDADRDRVVDVLCAAAGDGRLTADEFDERLEAALSSRTLDELAVLTADLTGGPGRSSVATAQAEDVMRINKHGGWVRRTGRWVVPRRLELRSSSCDVGLDFADAVITRDTVADDVVTHRYSPAGCGCGRLARLSLRRAAAVAPRVAGLRGVAVWEGMKINGTCCP